MTPPINATRKMPRGIVFIGFTASSVYVVTASKPRKEKQRIAAPVKSGGSEISNRKQPFLQRQVKAGDQVAVRVVDRQPLPDASPAASERVVAQESIPTIEFLYEDDHLLIVNKPAGMMVHPIKQEQSGTLVHVLADLFLAKGEQLSIHPVHRLDIRYDLDFGHKL